MVLGSWVALTETFLTSGSSGGIEGMSSTEFQSLREFQRKSGPFHHKGSSISSWAPATQEAISAGLDSVPT